MAKPKKPKGLPVPREKLAQYFASHPVKNKTRAGQALIKHNPKTYKAALALVSKRRNARLNDPNEVVKPLTPRTLDQRADALAGAQFDPAIRASNQLSNTQIPQWYADYQAKLQQ